MRYIELLQTSCAAYDANYFTSHYAELSALGLLPSKSELLDTLRTAEATIGNGNNLGEIILKNGFLKFEAH